MVCAFHAGSGTAPGGSGAASTWKHDFLEAAQKRAGLRSTGGLPILRHTFCSHLAMRGAPAKAIHELAGHAELTTTASCRAPGDAQHARTGRFFWRDVGDEDPSFRNQARPFVETSRGERICSILHGVHEASRALRARPSAVDGVQDRQKPREWFELGSNRVGARGFEPVRTAFAQDGDVARLSKRTLCATDA
jgi:hypothetical protein